MQFSQKFWFSGSKLGPKWTKTVNFVCVPFGSKFRLLKDFLKAVLALMEDNLWQKLTTDKYFKEVFHLTKSWGVKMSLKISFLAQF